VKSVNSNPFLPSSLGMINVGVLVSSIESNEKGFLVHYLLKSDGSYKNFNGNENSIDCTSFAFLSKTKLACFDMKTNALNVLDVGNVSNSVKLECETITSESIESIYQGPQGKLIMKFRIGIVCLVDINTRKISQETNEISDLKFVIWNVNMSFAALVGEKSILIVNKNLEITHRIRENSNIKSAVFDENSVLFYSTYFHIKYSLINGLNGIIKSTDMSNYLLLVSSSVIYYSDIKNHKNSFKFNYIEIRFNLALMNKNYDDTVNILKTGQVSGIKIVEDLKENGFPDLSLKFVKDPKQKFLLALQSGKLEEAFAVADELKDKSYYNRLAEKAMLLGKLSIVEHCYIKAQNLDKLMFFYSLSGKYDKLKKLDTLLQNKGDSNRRLINTIYTGNSLERTRILYENKHCKYINI
jgi:coatomer protein complex subunit alpha (xenin)